MLSTSEDEPIRYQVVVNAHTNPMISGNIKKNLEEIILEPQTKAIIEGESIEVSNNTFDRIYTR